MRIAITQMESVPQDLQTNLAKIEDFISLAKTRKADVITFPEDSLTGSVRNSPHLVDSKFNYRKIFSSLSKRYKIDIVSGSFTESENNALYNTSGYFDRSGKLLGSYRKINLWLTERDYLSKGTELGVVDTRFGKVGLAICWDLINPLIFRKMAKLGAKIIYVSSLWYAKDSSTMKIETKNTNSLCHVRSFENECVIVFTNAVGGFKDNNFGIGNSQIVLPARGVVKKLPLKKEALTVVEVPFGSLDLASKFYKIKKDIDSNYSDSVLL